MPPALTPELALEYLRALSTDLRAGVVLAADGERLAGPPPLAEPARRLITAAPGRTELAVDLPGGRVFAARAGGHAIVLACGPHALAALVGFDLRAVLADLVNSDAGEAPGSGQGAPRDGPPTAEAGALEPLAAAFLAAASGAAAAG